VEDYDIVIRPLITEQSLHFANAKNAYSFEVNKKATGWKAFYRDGKWAVSKPKKKPVKKSAKKTAKK